MEESQSYPDPLVLNELLSVIQIEIIHILSPVRKGLP